MDQKNIIRIASCGSQSKLFPEIPMKMVIFSIFLLISVLNCVAGNKTILVNTSDFENSPTVYRFKRATSLSSTTSKPKSKTSTQTTPTTTKDPTTVLAEQLAEVAKQREAARQQDEENRRKDLEKQKKEAELREREKQLQEKEVIRQREEAAAKQPQQGDKKPPEETTNRIEVKNQKDGSGDEKQDDEKIQETAAQLVAQKYLRRNDNNITVIDDLINQCKVENCFNKVIKQAVDIIMSKIKISTLIKSERGLNSSVEESTSLYKFASDKISKKDYTGWIDLAIRVKEITNVTTAYNITKELNLIKNKLPVAIKNLVFSTKVCIRNVKYDEFLYAVGSPELWYDNNRRHVYTRLGGRRNDTGETNEFYWLLQSVNGTNEFTIRNRKHKEYLFVDSSKWDDRNRFVFTWTDDKPVTQHVWQITLNSDGRYFEVKNTQNNEYLFADYDRIVENTMRSVFTYTDGTNTKEGLWNFVNCSKEA